jgi:ubiquinone/menaquinone biosynthesis C-methylase UbiE
MPLDSQGVEEFYRHRFGAETQGRDDLWAVLCQNFFQKWVPKDSTVLDIAAGYCEFSNNIVAARRIAMDLNPDVVKYAAAGVETINGRSDDMSAIEDNSIDIAFVSNFFEHVDRDVILATLMEALRVLKPGGRILILQPNIRFCAKDYWQFFDHITPVDDRALVEALVATGFEMQTCIARFLPYTTKGKLPATPALVKLYLKVPLAWRILGAQSFLVATAP